MNKKITSTVMAALMIMSLSVQPALAAQNTNTDVSTISADANSSETFGWIVDNGLTRGTSAPSINNKYPLNKGGYESTVQFDSNLYTDFYLYSPDTGKITVTTDVKAYTNKACTTEDANASYSFTVWLICSDGSKQSEEHNVNTSNETTFTVSKNKYYYVKLSNPESQYSKHWVKGDITIVD